MIFSLAPDRLPIEKSPILAIQSRLMKRYLFSLLLIATTTALFNSCQKEVSYENSDIPSVGLLQSDISGVCAPMTVNGIYEAGTQLVAADNYIDVEVDVATLGSYTIYSDTLNGVWFRATGNFTTIGLNTIRLPGSGTPTADGIFTYTITYGLSECTVDVAVLPNGGAVPAEFELEGDPGTCLNYNLLGAYTTGVALTSANKVEISIDVITPGTYDITTTPSNGITFSGQGVLASVGSATITLTASGMPTTSGATNILVTDGATTCSFEVDVTGAAAFTINCGSAAPNGTLVEGTSATGNFSVDVGVNVTAIGTYTISGTINGLAVSKTATFTTTGATTVNLPVTGIPTDDGNFNMTLNGGTGTCTIPLTVAPAPTGAASYAVQCGTAVPNGTYTQGVALTTTNTVTVTVNVTAVGSYTITGTANNMTFSKTGTFTTTGPQTIQLNGTGNPTNGGAITVPLTGGTPTCSITVNVTPAGPTPAVFTIDCTSAEVEGFYTEGVQMTAANFIDVDVNVTQIGTYTITGTINGMTFSRTGSFTSTGVQPVRLNAGTTAPAADGDFNVPLTGGTGTCSVEVTVFANIGTWSFTQGATTYSGIIVEGGFDPTAGLPPPAQLFFFAGTNGPQDVFIVEMIDIDGVIGVGETYKMQPQTLPTDNIARFFFQAGTPPIEYSAHPVDDPTNMVLTVAAHNTTTRTISGTFAGNANDQTGTPVPITAGTFSFTYP